MRGRSTGRRSSSTASLSAAPYSGATPSLPCFGICRSGKRDGRQIASDAAVVLPESGGSLSRRVENYDGVVVRFAEAVSEVSGVERDGVAFTTSTITIRDIDIMNVVHADRIVLRATSRQSIGESEGSMSDRKGTRL